MTGPEQIQVMASVATILSGIGVIGGGIWAVRKMIRQDGIDTASSAAAAKNAEAAAKAASGAIRELRKENRDEHEKIHDRISRSSAETTQQIKALKCEDHAVKIGKLEARLNSWEHHDERT